MALRVRRAELTERPFQVLGMGPVSRFFVDARRALSLECCRQLGIKEYAPKSFGLHLQPAIEYDGFWERLLLRVKDAAHGGTIIVVPDAWSADDERLVSRIRLKYIFRGADAWGRIVSALLTRRRAASARLPSLPRGERPKARPTIGGALRDKLISDGTQIALRETIASFAALAGVDGAVVMTDRLRVLGFGGEILSEPRALTHVLSADGELGESGSTVSLEAFGTRHRSVFRLCSSAEEIIGFVVSSDGGVKAVRRCGSRVVMWGDVALGIDEAD